MKVTLEKTFPMPASADTAWTLLQDIESVATCMPGARITERIDAEHYKGTVSVKFGPASMAFRGEVEVKAMEPASRTLRLIGKGTDSSGSSGAAMDLTARIAAVDAWSCSLVGVSEVSMSGKAATFGARMMGSVADQVLKQFAANFASRVQELQARQPAAPTGPAAATVDVSKVLDRPASVHPEPFDPSQDRPVEGQKGFNLSTSSGQAKLNPNGPAPAQLNALALLWAMVWDWLQNLFSAKKT